MGLIREPLEVDFYVIDKPWSEQEIKEFSELIKKRKDQFKKQKEKVLRHIRQTSRLKYRVMKNQ